MRAAMHTFFRYDLRTTDPDAARAFYANVAGIDFATSPELGLWPLHEQARARGAPAHWLGHIAVDDVDREVARFVAEGAERLGPTVRTGDGATYAALRDPLGSVIS